MKLLGSILLIMSMGLFGCSWLGSDDKEDSTASEDEAKKDGEAKEAETKEAGS